MILVEFSCRDCEGYCTPCVAFSTLCHDRSNNVPVLDPHSNSDNMSSNSTTEQVEASNNKQVAVKRSPDKSEPPVELGEAKRQKTEAQDSAALPKEAKGNGEHDGRTEDVQPQAHTKPDEAVSAFNPNWCLQRRVAKYFGDYLYRGRITEAFHTKTGAVGQRDLSTDENVSSWLWHVSYDDGDEEDWDYDELQAGLSACSEAGETDESTRPDTFMHIRVAKFSSGNMLFGSVVSTLKEGELWGVEFDDGSVQEWDLDGVRAGIQLCSHKVKDTNMSLWDIYQLDRRSVLKNLKGKSIPKLPKHFVDNYETVVEFYLFTMERQRCWIRRRDHGKMNPERWTNNRALREFHFCNVYRELDRGTCWFHGELLTSYYQHIEADKPRREWFLTVLWASYCYRLVNRIESFMAPPDDKRPSPTAEFRGIPGIEDWPKFKIDVRKARKDGHTFFTGAHQTCGFSNYIKWLDDVYRNRERLENVADQATSLEACFNAIFQNLPGCGPFLSWQILCDLVESNCLEETPDAADFCVLGKGAKAGVRAIFFPGKSKLQGTLDYLKYAKDLVNHQDIYQHLEEGRNLQFPRWQDRPLTLKEIEHTLCEFQKFQKIDRALLGSGPVQGQRLRKSRASNSMCACRADLDLDDIACDTCNHAFCTECHNEQNDKIREFDSELPSHYDSWICKACTDLSIHEWS